MQIDKNIKYIYNLPVLLVDILQMCISGILACLRYTSHIAQTAVSIIKNCMNQLCPQKNFVSNIQKRN